jgi:dCTP deaminase
MFLSFDGLKRAIEDADTDPAYRLQVEPYDPSRLRSASIELHLGNTIARWRNRSHGGSVITQMSPMALDLIDERHFEIQRGLGPGDLVTVAPGEHLLMAVDSWVALGPGLIGRLEGKSTLARAGQLIHAAGFVDPGFVGILVCEPMNMAPFPVVYRVGQAIAQLAIARLDQPSSRPYGHPEMLSRYQGQHEVTPPKSVSTGSPWAVTPGMRRYP